jgi:hypothetical protein
MVKVCHIISGYFRIEARVFQRQCKSLKNNGFEVSVLTNDGEPEEVIDGIPFYSCNKEKAYEMGQNGIKAILNEFNWVSQEKLYLDIFKKHNQS